MLLQIKHQMLLQRTRMSLVRTAKMKNKAKIGKETERLLGNLELKGYKGKNYFLCSAMPSSAAAYPNPLSKPG